MCHMTFYLIRVIHNLVLSTTTHMAGIVCEVQNSVKLQFSWPAVISAVIISAVIISANPFNNQIV